MKKLLINKMEIGKHFLWKRFNREFMYNKKYLKDEKKQKKAFILFLNE